YWNEGGKENVKEAFLYLVNQYFFKTNRAQEPVAVTPPIGLLHPRHKGYFTDAKEYLEWHKSNSSLPHDAPVVSLILYRKHVITKQDYIRQLIEYFEDEGLRPLPIFINGVEAHTVVRDMLTTSHEQQQRSQGAIEVPSLSKNAVHVDAIVNTIGFPLVGGPAGSMEGGRQAEVAKAILTAKNVPYLVAAPMLIQDMESWTRDGIGGLQSIVLYALPELDGAVDTVTLGGLVGDDIFLSGERVKALATRLRKWINLRRTPPSDRRIAVLLYGFPPGVGATGTAALLNVPKSLEAFFKSLKAAGYDLGNEDAIPDGEAVVDVLRAMDDERAVLKGRAGLQDLVANLDDSMTERLPNVTSGGDEVTPAQLQEWLTFPSEWGPSEWGPIPFLPSSTLMLDNLQRQWGDVRSYRGIKSAGAGQLVVPGVQLGNVWIGVQPVLGLEGDPMRLLFERDLTPHPQYAAFYKWLQNGLVADAVVHFGMHGTVEWLPGTPLGNTGFSWSDALLGPLPNVYVYAANNPSESIVAKRRGYGTIVSHNVPPYGRAGLYKQLAELKDLVNDAREAPDAAQSLREPILAALVGSGLQEDCPFGRAPPSPPRTSTRL
ncbi:Magnesium chelatase, partial [Cymbomonas tetramitiformis]